MIKFNNVTKKYGENSVIENADFYIPLNKTTCILGDSGAGKTTLLNILAKTIEIDGGSIENLPISSSYVFQEHRLILNKTVMQNLTLFTGEKDVSKIQKFLDKVNLLDKQNAYVSTLSGGEKQRVNIVRALIKNDGFILLDEPFNALDLSLKIKIANTLISHFKSQNTTAVIVTHDVNMAERLADEILIVKDKKVINLKNENLTNAITKILN